MRKAIAATVSYSKQHIPHFYVSYEIDMTKVINELEVLKQKKEGIIIESRELNGKKRLLSNIITSILMKGIVV